MNPDRSLVWIAVLPIRSANTSTRATGAGSGLEPDHDLDQPH